MPDRSHSAQRLSLTALVAASLASFAAGQLPCGANLLQNPGCEDPVTGPWVDPGGTWTCQSGPNPIGTTPAPHSGDGYFFAGVSDVAELYQDFDLGAYPAGQRFELFSYVAAADQTTLPLDRSQLELQCLDALGQAIAVSTSDSIGSLEWFPLSTAITAPPGAATLRAVLRAIRNQGDNNDGYFDDVYLTAVPTPGAGEANGAGASLIVNGVGPAAPGPYYETVLSGENLSVDVEGPPGSPCGVLIGSLVPGALDLGCSGVLELSPFSVWVNGVTDEVGRFGVDVLIPTSLNGVGFSLQGFVLQPASSSCVFELSAAFCVGIQ